MEFHHDKHHKAYVDKTNELVTGTDLEGKSLEEVILRAHRSAKQTLFNQAGQVWNHNFFWNSLSPKGGGSPQGELRQRIDRDCGGVDGFSKAFKDAAVGQFGSGWAWLVLKDDKLEVISTEDGVPAFVDGATPLLTLDVWEHAYYLDYQNRRPDFVETFLKHLVNWDFAATQLREAASGQKRYASG